MQLLLFGLVIRGEEMFGNQEVVTVTATKITDDYLLIYTTIVEW